MAVETAPGSNRSAIMLLMHRLVGWAPAFGGVRAALRWTSHQTGLPAIVVAAVALVISWRIFRRWLGFSFEVAIALTLLFVATRLGWIAW